MLWESVSPLFPYSPISVSPMAIMQLSVLFGLVVGYLVAIACDGFISALSGLFGCMPITSFSQNVGLVAMTKVVNRFAIATGAIIMILAGIFPFFGSVLATLPLPLFHSVLVSALHKSLKSLPSSHRLFRRYLQRTVLPSYLSFPLF